MSGAGWNAGEGPRGEDGLPAHKPIHPWTILSPCNIWQCGQALSRLISTGLDDPQPDFTCESQHEPLLEGLSIGTYDHLGRFVQYSVDIIDVVTQMRRFLPADRLSPTQAWTDLMEGHDDAKRLAAYKAWKHKRKTTAEKAAPDAPKPLKQRAEDRQDYWEKRMRGMDTRKRKLRGHLGVYLPFELEDEYREGLSLHGRNARKIRREARDNFPAWRDPAQQENGNA